MWSTTWGRQILPPFAIAEYATASCIGVTVTNPCPIAIWMSSPGSQLCSCGSSTFGWSIANCFFQVGSGISPVVSSGRSSLVAAPNPNCRRLFWSSVAFVPNGSTLYRS